MKLKTDQRTLMMSSSTADQLCRRFTLAQIKLATGDFSDEHLIGRGGFGKVYKGIVDNGSTTVAMKRLASNSNQGEREFAAEMETLTKFRHRNLVSLIGYCNDQGEMILVYDYMAKGTLSDHLYNLSGNDGDGGASLTWVQRLKICIGAARGLDYLHSGCSIIHRDVKSTNILLDENFVAKVSDFGLAKHFNADNSETHVTASVKGSFGYFDPCYFTTGMLTRASDTYAFGVVLLEVLSGKPAVDRRLTENELCLTMWAQEKFRSGKIDQIVASNLRGEISDDCLKTFVGVARRCLLYEPKKRLTMTRVVVQLELALEQQERKGSANKSYFRTLNAFWSRVIPSGSSQMEGKQAEDNLPEIAVTVQHQLAEMKAITKDFSSERLISETSLEHIVFYGVLKSGQKAAVQKLRPYKKLPDQEFLAKVSIISSLQHENVVKLLDYSVDGGEQVLAYEFAPRGSLHDILHGRRRQSFIMMQNLSIFSWAPRINIAVEVAKGLDYVHHKALIHGNIKSSNILLFDNKLAKITDFPLLTEFPCETDDLVDRPYPKRDTGCGYHPPECNLSLQTQKWDVYSFGVVLLELLTGKNLYDRNKYLVHWAKPHLSVRDVHKIVDVRLKGDITPKAMAMMACVASACLDERLDFRPDMSAVLRALLIASRETQGYLLKNRYSHNTGVSSWSIATPLAKLKDITGDLIFKLLIANGSNRGCIFHGFLESGEHVAIRELYLNLPCQELLDQVSIVTRLKHENMVQLLGYCMEGGQLSLAFEFAPQGSLHDILHGQQDIELLGRGLSSKGCKHLQQYLKIARLISSGTEYLSLAQRVRISVEAAKGLEYIHRNEEIHGDFKTQRVLLFDEDVVKIAYVGRIYKEDGTANCPCSLDNKTYWYHAPECKIPGKRSWRIDVYSFGAVLMELLTRHKTVDYTQKLEQCIDSTLVLKGKNPHKPVLKMAGIAEMCLQYEADLRPSMSVVVQQLQSLLDYINIDRKKSLC